MKAPGVCFVMTVLLLISSRAISVEVKENAALKYYQAILAYQEPDNETENMVLEYNRGKIEINDKIELFIERNREVINLIVAAAEETICDWGYDYSKGPDLMMPVLAEFRQMTYLLTTEARSLSDKGNYKKALQRCMSLHKMGVHAIDKMIITYLVGVAVSERANGCMIDVLGNNELDLQTLLWLKEELSKIDATFPLLSKSIVGEMDMIRMKIAENSPEEILQLASESLDGKLPGEIEKRLAQADKNFYLRNIDYLTKYMAEIQEILDQSKLYNETITKTIENKMKEIETDAVRNPDATLTKVFATSNLDKLYKLSMRHKNSINAARAAIEVYIKRSETGQLPNELPDIAPKDLYGGDKFEYERKTDGFVIRSKAKYLFDKKGRFYEYKFKVKK